MIGSDISFWMFLLRVSPLFFLAIATALIVRMSTRNPLNKTTFVLAIVMMIVLVMATWITFGSYGPGIAPDLPSVSEEGVNQRMADTPPEDVQGAAESAEAKIPAVLKQVRETAQGGSGSEEIDEDEKFRITVENALKVQSNQKARKSK